MEDCKHGRRNGCPNKPKPCAYGTRTNGKCPSKPCKWGQLSTGKCRGKPHPMVCVSGAIREPPDYLCKKSLTWRTDILKGTPKKRLTWRTDILKGRYTKRSPLSPSPQLSPPQPSSSIDLSFIEPSPVNLYSPTNQQRFNGYSWESPLIQPAKKSKRFNGYSWESN